MWQVYCPELEHWPPPSFNTHMIMRLRQRCAATTYCVRGCAWWPQKPGLAQIFSAILHSRGNESLEAQTSTINSTQHTIPPPDGQPTYSTTPWSYCHGCQRMKFWSCKMDTWGRQSHMDDSTIMLLYDGLVSCVVLLFLEKGYATASFLLSPRYCCTC